jgi:hypothetical protein
MEAGMPSEAVADGGRWTGEAGVGTAAEAGTAVEAETAAEEAGTVVEAEAGSEDVDHTCVSYKPEYTLKA